MISSPLPPVRGYKTQLLPMRVNCKNIHPIPKGERHYRKVVLGFDQRKYMTVRIELVCQECMKEKP